MSIRTVRPLTSRTGVTAMPAVPLERQARRDQRLPQSSRPGLPGPLTPPGSAGWRYPRNVPDPMLLPDLVVLLVLAGRLVRPGPMILDRGRPMSREPGPPCRGSVPRGGQRRPPPPGPRPAAAICTGSSRRMNRVTPSARSRRTLSPRPASKGRSGRPSPILTEPPRAMGHRPTLTPWPAPGRLPNSCLRPGSGRRAVSALRCRPRPARQIPTGRPAAKVPMRDMGRPGSISRRSHTV